MATEPNKVEACMQDISGLVETFASQEQDNKQSLQQLAGGNPGVFCAAAIRVLAASKASPGLRYLVNLLTKSRALTAGLMDSRTCTPAEAVAACRVAIEVGAQLQSALEIALTQALQASSSPQNSSRILRILDMMAATGAQSSWNSFQLELMAYPDKIVRSKAALLIGKNIKNIAWIGRRLMDRDPRVQASAVEALWGNHDPEARSLLAVALKSKNNRVAANAALGLYRIADQRAVSGLLEMMRHPDAAFRRSALWAIGQTGDPRFLPALKEQFQGAEGKVRLAIAGAMSHIRRRERGAAGVRPIEFHGALGLSEPDGTRRLSFALSATSSNDLGNLPPTAFALWESQQLVQTYDVKPLGNPTVLVAGFVVPQFSCEDEPYARAICDGLSRCLTLKRPDDLWRIDRYSGASAASAEPEAASQSPLPYDESVMTPELKMRHGCMADRGLLAQVIPMKAPADRTAPGSLEAIERQGQALLKHSGKRHLFLLLHEMDAALTPDPAIARLRSLAPDNSIVFHVLCQDVSAPWGALRDFCLSNPEGTFEQGGVEALAEKLGESYSRLLNRYAITYSLPAKAEAGPVMVSVSSQHGAGRAEFCLASPTTSPQSPAEAAVELPAQTVAEPSTELATEPAEVSIR